MCACTVDNPLAKARGLSLRTGAQTMLYLTGTIITSVDLAHYGVSRAKDWVSLDCGTIGHIICDVKGHIGPPVVFINFRNIL